MGHKSIVWYGSILRGDENEIEIGCFTSIQEGSVITADSDFTDFSIDIDGTGGRVPGFPGTVFVGDYVTIEPGCVLRGCRVENRVLIGAGSVICEGALVEAGSIIGPNSLVPPGRRVPARQMWAGVPAQFVKELDDSEEELELLALENYRRR